MPHINIAMNWEQTMYALATVATNCKKGKEREIVEVFRSHGEHMDKICKAYEELNTELEALQT